VTATRPHPAVGVLVALLVFVAVLLHGGRSHAQITLDGSLGPSGPLTGPDFVIDSGLGQIRGSNLFHSFGQFNVQTGQSATFTGPGSIANILSRVTGGQRSFIDGLLASTIPGANLFLLNPSGVLLGPNAVLDVKGAFHVSTADYLRFADGARFSSSLAQGSTLTIAQPAAFGFLAPPAPISIQGSVLEVPAGRELSVVGGDIQIAGAALFASGGRIQIASVASAGEATFGGAGQAVALNVDSFTRLGSVAISDNTLLDASGDPGGTVLIRGGSVTVDGSSIFADTQGDSDGARLGIDLRAGEDAVLQNATSVGTFAFGDGRGGDVRVTAGTLLIDGSIVNTTAFGTGGAGDINVGAGTVALTGGARVGSTTEGDGPGGSTTLTASDSVTLSGRDAGGNASGLVSDTIVSGDGGRLAVSAPLLIMDGGTIASSTFGQGRGGDLVLDVGRLSLSGQATITSHAGGFAPGGTLTVTSLGPVTLSGASSVVSRSCPGSACSGRAGDIVFDVGTLTLEGGSAIRSGSNEAPQGSNVTVSARDSVVISGGSVLSSQAFQQDVGRVDISAASLAMSDGGRITTSTLDRGQAGDISVTVGTLSLTRGAQISSSSERLASGRGGNLAVTATDRVSVSGSSGRGDPSGLFSSAASRGDAGQVTVAAPLLTLTDGGRISVGTSGSGRAGDITVSVQNLSLAGGGRIDSGTTGAGRGGTATIVSGDVTMTGGDIAAQTSGEGRAGDIVLNVGRLSLAGGSQIDSSTLGAGQGGTVTIVATESVTIAGQDDGMTCTANGTGAAGQVAIFTPTLTMEEGALVSAATLGAGPAGDVRLQIGRLTLSGGSSITSSTSGGGQGGTVGVTASDSVTLTRSRLASSAEAAGAGGDIDLSAPQVRLSDGAQISATSSGTGNAGQLKITAADSFVSSDSAVTTGASVADGGNVTLRVGNLVHLVGSAVTAAVQSGQGQGGNIVIDPQFVILDKSQIRADAFGGPGGNVRIVANVFLTSDSVVSASSALGLPGTVDISAPITDVSGSLTQLPEAVLQAAALLRESCAARFAEGARSTLTLGSRDGIPPEPGGTVESPLVVLEAAGVEPAGAVGGAGSQPFRVMVDLRCSR
jgi:filamentous hemagglutinin family protein